MQFDVPTNSVVKIRVYYPKSELERDWLRIEAFDFPTQTNINQNFFEATLLTNLARFALTVIVIFQIGTNYHYNDIEFIKYT